MVFFCHWADKTFSFSPSGRGKHGRRHSPIPQPQLQQISSQAEATVISSTNSLDPFLDNDSSLSSIPSSSVPSRKSVNRKQHPPLSSLVHAEAIPVPVTTRRQMPNISRSDPLPSHVRQRPRPVSALPSTFQYFPICDDMNDVVDLGAPATPPPSRRHHDNGLQTAPISSRTPGAFPFNTMGLPSSPPPLASKRNRKHHRTPSEGVFHMSSDDDLSSEPGGTTLNPNVQALFGLVNTSKPSSKMSPSAFSTPIRAIPPFKRESVSLSYVSLSNEKPSERETAEKAAGYFASSMFQNSPGPEELPDPLLF